MKKKVILTGNPGVGKTSIFNYQATGQFSEEYIPSIGVRVEKVVAPNNQLPTLFFWDLAGAVSQEEVPRSYFFATDHIVYITDLTRPSTFLNLESDIAFFHNILPEIPITIIGNKVDLITSSQSIILQKSSPIPFQFLTSVKTMQNIEALYDSLTLTKIREDWQLVG